MRFFPTSMAVMVLASLTTAVFADDAVIPLSEGWRLQSSAEVEGDGAAFSSEGKDVSSWYPTTVPKTVLAALVDNEVYPDPYYGTNLKSIPGYQEGSWLVMKEDSPFRAHWWYRTEFIMPKEAKGRVVTLHFGGINFQANIWLNGQLVAGADKVRGMFRSFEFTVTDLLRFGGANALAVEIIPPGLIEDKKYNTKQVEATTGWDDHNPQPPDMNMGIWQPVSLRVQGPVSLRNAYVETKLETPGLARAELTLSAFARNNTDKAVTATVTAAIESVKLSQEISLEPGEAREIFFRPGDYPGLAVANPRVWWPHPLGPQELYTLDMSATVKKEVSDTAKVRFGIRDITTAVNEEDWRYYMVNGRKVLIRGGAWMTSDMMLNLSHERYEALVRYAREAGFNMLRSEGFSIRETEDFYNLCDELGVMVTQQLFGRSIPDEELAVACIDDMMLRVRTHPSLAHFLAHDETFPTETLDAAYQGLIARHRVNRTYQPHSGTFNIATRKETGGTRTGTRELWTYAGPSHYYMTEKRPYDTAWGFAQSGGIGGILASRDSLRQMMPEDQLWPAMETEAWSFHTVTQGADYFYAVRQMMEETYGPAQNLDQFCDRVYAMNYNSARGMYEAYARNRYKATGITTWKYDAAWPAAMTWHYVDWYLRATAAYYGAKKACTPLHALYAYDDGAVYVTNSYYADKPGLKVRATAYDLKGAPAGRQEAVVDVGEDSVAKAFAAPVPEGLDTWFLRLELLGADGAPIADNTYWLSKTPDIPGRSGDKKGVFYVKPKSVADFKALAALPPATVDVSSDGKQGEKETVLSVGVKNTGTAPAFLVQLSAKDPSSGLELGPVYWSDNYLVLMPGETRNLTATLPNRLVQGGMPLVAVTAMNVK